MQKFYLSATFLVTLAVSAFMLMTCSSETTAPVEPNPNPAVLTVSPSSGAPGTLLNISGYTVNPADTATAIYIGGELSVLLQDSAGLESMIPLFLDSASHWPAPPAGAVDVEIRKNGEVVARATAAVTVDSLQHANGATETLNQDFIKLANSLRTIWSVLPSIPGEDSAMAGYRQAVMTMLDSVLTGADSSMASVLAGTSSWTGGQVPDMALMDALLASSGALEFYNDAAGSLGRLTDSLTLARQQGLLCKGGGEDMDLACQMQIYVVLDDYATYFVKPTSQTYANTVGLVAGIVAISGYRFPPEVIISALMTVFDFVYGTLAPSLFPANITEFSLTVATDTIAVDEYTNTAVLVAASNNPSTIRATDVLEQLLSALGFAGAPAKIVENFREVLVNAMKWALGMYRKGVEAYNKDTNDSVFIDPEGDLPPMSWGPVMVTHSDLVQLYSFTEDIITADTTAFEWKGVSRGDGRIQARGRGAGERSKVLYDNALCIGCSYFGGAFGNNAPGTETKTVVVGKPSELEVVITGLPNGVAASVIVMGPGGYNSGTLNATDTLRGLDAGDYQLTAVDVQDNTGEVYQPDPLDTTVTLADGDQGSVVVAYKKKYGNILLTVAGLPSGVAPDVSIAGPNGYQKEVFSEGLIDSLLAGEYTLTAHDVINTRTSDTLSGKPVRQIISVVGGQTSAASVDYNAGLQVNVYYGPTGRLGHASAELVAQGGLVDGNEQFATDGYDTTKFEVANCAVVGYQFGSVSGSAGAGSSASTAGASGGITTTHNGFSITSSASASASLAKAETNGGDTSAGANANLNFGAGSSITGFNKGVVLDIANPSQDTVEIHISWSNSASSSTSVANYVYGVAHAGMAMAIPFDPCRLPYTGNDVILSGCNSPGMQFHCSGDTVVVTTLAHIQAAFTTEVSAGSNFHQSDLVAVSGSGNANLRLSVSVRKR